MSKPQWKLDIEAKERVVKEREEAERRVKAEKLASLSGPSHAEEPAPQPHSNIEDTNVVPELGLVEKEEAIDHEKQRLQRHLETSAATAPHKSQEQIQKEHIAEEQKRMEQQRSDEMMLKMQRKMAEFEAQMRAQQHQSSGLVITTEEEEFDEESRKRQAAMNIGKFIKM